MAELEQEHATVAEEIRDTTIDKEAVYDKLRECYDPEIPVNIVDLGLIYALKITGGVVSIIMTLTAIGCPVGPEVMAEVEGRVREVDGVEECNVTLTFDPPWTTDRMTEDAKWELGMA
jgi:metal-sulfur cluster biosynthetic enzyme